MVHYSIYVGPIPNFIYTTLFAKWSICVHPFHRQDGVPHFKSVSRDSDHVPLRCNLSMGGGTGGYRGYMYPPPFLEGGYKRVHSVKVCVYPVVR